ncbi:MAG: hypothetical protein JWO57_1384 [Pseudonocardiales bacterium]|nr:hypothetical protein [Pseudonocardiales bacterium]
MTFVTLPARRRPSSAHLRKPHLVTGLPASRRGVKGLAWVLAAVVLGLVGWIVVLGLSLPSSASTREWRLVWIGFDVGELAALLVTLWAIYRSRQIAIPAALITGTLFICDAWFDVVLSWGTSGWWLSVVSAAFVELPLAAVLWLSARSLVHALINSNLAPLGANGRPARLRDLDLFPADPLTELDERRDGRADWHVVVSRGVPHARHARQA